MSLDTERALYQKVIIAILAAMMVIFAAWTAVSRTHEGVLFQETLLEVSEQGDTTVYSGTVYGTPVTITSREENDTKFVNFSADGEYYAECRVEYPEGTITTEYGKEVMRLRIIRNEEVLFSGGYDPAPDGSNYLKYFDEDGSWNPMVTVSGAGNGNPWHYFELTASSIMHFSNSPATSVRGSWGFYFIALFTTIIGVLLVAFPETSFYFSHFLSVRDPEPTDFYYACHKIGSVLYVGVVLILYLRGVFFIE